MRRGLHNLDDRVLREEGVVRIYDIFFQYDVLLKTDQFFREIISAPEFQRTMSTAEFHHLAGKYVLERSRVLHRLRVLGNHPAPRVHVGDARARLVSLLVHPVPEKSAIVLHRLFLETVEQLGLPVVERQRVRPEITRPFVTGICGVARR